MRHNYIEKTIKSFIECLVEIVEDNIYENQESYYNGVVKERKKKK